MHTENYPPTVVIQLVFPCRIILIGWTRIVTQDIFHFFHPLPVRYRSNVGSASVRFRKIICGKLSPVHLQPVIFRLFCKTVLRVRMAVAETQIWLDIIYRRSVHHIRSAHNQLHPSLLHIKSMLKLRCIEIPICRFAGIYYCHKFDAAQPDRVRSEGTARRKHAHSFVSA